MSNRPDVPACAHPRARQLQLSDVRVCLVIVAAAADRRRRVQMRVLACTVLLVLTGCQPGGGSNTHARRLAATDLTPSVTPVGAPSAERRRPKPATHRTGTKANTRKLMPNKFHGDGFTSKGRNKCSNMPFPGPITTAFQMHECWEGIWHPRPGRLNDLMYMLGYKPGSHRQQQQMIVGLANGATRVVNLRSRDGLATLAHFGRTCGVITYSDSNQRTYYMPLRHKIVGHCRWKH